jgi:hypothetical protein
VTKIWAVFRGLDVRHAFLRVLVRVPLGMTFGGPDHPDAHAS